MPASLLHCGFFARNAAIPARQQIGELSKKPQPAGRQMTIVFGKKFKRLRKNTSDRARDIVTIDLLITHMPNGMMIVR
jgi:hypothetical protein